MHKKFTNSVERAERISVINRELEKLEERLQKPERTVADMVRHMQLIKELKRL